MTWHSSAIPEYLETREEHLGGSQPPVRRNIHRLMNEEHVATKERVPPVTAALVGEEFTFSLEFNKILTEPVGDVTVDIKVVLEVPYRSLTLTCETYMYWYEVVALASTIRSIVQLNNTLVQAKDKFLPLGCGFAVRLASIKAYHGDPTQMSPEADRMPCRVSLSLAHGPADKKLGSMLGVESNVATHSALQFASELDKAVKKKRAQPGAVSNAN